VRVTVRSGHAVGRAERPSARRVIGVIASLACVGLLLALGAGPAAADTCPNAQFRAGAGATLPDCRAYEQVSPVSKDGFDVAFGPNGTSSSPGASAETVSSGDEVSYYSFGSFAGNPAAAFMNQYLSTRGPSGWTTQGISPAKQAPFTGIDTHTAYTGFSSDLSEMAVVNWAEPGVYSLLRRNADGSFDTVLAGAVGSTPPTFAGASADFSQILVQTSTTGVGDQVFEWNQGQLEPVSGVDGAPTLGTVAGPFGAEWGRAISADGSRAFWTVAAGAPGLYMYMNGTNTNIASSQCTTGVTGASGPGGNCAAPGSTGSASFETSSTDGTDALFTSPRELTNNATTGTANQGSDLYSYDTSSGTLTDLTVDSTDPDGADVLGVVAASEDDSYVYFVANGVLAKGATPGACGSGGASTAQCNLYLWHDGTPPTFVATVGQADSNDWANSNALQHSAVAQVSADGQHLLFASTASPTSYDSDGANEVYLYDAGTGELHCTSCSPTDAAAVSGADLGRFTNNPQDGTAYNNVSADGTRVFFESSDQLLPQDSNGLENVYEWEAVGSGSCQSPTDSNGGCLYSISTGSSSSPDYFQNSTPSGNDVFFVTRQQLVGQDDDETVDMYDARVGGGLASQYPPPTSPPCSDASGCRGAPGSPPPALTDATGSFDGPGDATPAAAAKPTPKVRISTRIADGTSFMISARVPGSGQVTISGSGVTRISRSFSRAGTDLIRIRLATKERGQLVRRHRLKLKLTARYAPLTGRASSTAFALTVTGGAR